MFTDHNTVIFINNIQNKSHILTRWGLMLQGYNLIKKHIKCNDSFIANDLSRIEIQIYCKKFVSKPFIQERRCYVYIINMRNYFCC